jgi:hypothetical protein
MRARQLELGYVGPEVSEAERWLLIDGDVRRESEHERQRIAKGKCAVSDPRSRPYYTSDEVIQAEVERRFTITPGYRMQRTIIDGVASGWEPY